MLALVTCLIADAEALWRLAPTAMGEAQTTLHGILAADLKTHHGKATEVGRAQVALAFDDALSALRWCMSIQQALLDAPWPQALLDLDAAAELREGEHLLFRGLRLAVGVHSGQPILRHNPLTGRDDYVGPEVLAVGSLARAAAPGQTLISDALWDDLGPAGQAALDARVTRLADTPLSGFDAPCRLRQILPASLALRTFAPLIPHKPTRTNLAAPLSTFVGRQEAMTSLTGLFEQNTRVVTLLGHGGTGKTCLAQHFGRMRLEEDPAAGVWFCDLIEARALEDIVALVAEVLDGKPTAGQPPLEQARQLGAAIHTRGPVLIILDNFEQITDFATDTVAVWAAAAPEARFLITSRRPLGLVGEHRFHLGPMTTDEATALFKDRAHTASDAPEADRAQIEALVQRLEGLPLAIELAAARAGLLSVPELEARLAESLALLDTNAAASFNHHGTLQGAIEWSWQLLTPWARDALAQCAIFRGGWSLNAAEAVLDLSRHPDAPTIIEALGALRDWSLVRVDTESNGERRFHLFESVRTFAAEHLDPTAHSALALRHAHHHLALGEPWASGVEGPEAFECLANLSREFENLLAARSHTQTNAPLLAARTALVLDRIMATRGPFDLHLEVLTTAIEALDALGESPILLGRLLVARGDRFWRLHDPAARRHDLERAIDLARTHGDKTLLCEALLKLTSMSLYHTSTYRLEATREATSQARALENPVILFKALTHQGIAALIAGEQDESAGLLEEALVLAQRHGNARAVGIITSNLAGLAMRRGQIDRARTYYTTSLTCFRQFNVPRQESLMLNNLGSLEMNIGRGQEALMRYKQALTLCQAVGDLRIEALVLGNRGILHFERGELAAARADLTFADHYFRGVNDIRRRAVFLAFRGAVQAALDQRANARETFDTTHALRESIKDPETLDLTHLLEGFLDLACADHDPKARARVLARLEQHEASEDSPPSAVQHAANLLKQAVQKRFPDLLTRPVEKTALLIAHDAAWIQPHERERVDLARRGSIRRILASLLDVYETQPGTPKGVVALQEAGWPGQKLMGGSGANRVYVAIATLRKLGLGNTLRTNAEGYFLDPTATIQRDLPEH